MIVTTSYGLDIYSSLIAEVEPPYIWTKILDSAKRRNAILLKILLFALQEISVLMPLRCLDLLILAGDLRLFGLNSVLVLILVTE